MGNILFIIPLQQTHAAQFNIPSIFSVNADGLPGAKALVKCQALCNDAIIPGRTGLDCVFSAPPREFTCVAPYRVKYDVLMWRTLFLPVLAGVCVVYFWYILIFL